MLDGSTLTVYQDDHLAIYEDKITVKRISDNALQGLEPKPYLGFTVDVLCDGFYANMLSMLVAKTTPTDYPYDSLSLIAEGAEYFEIGQTSKFSVSTADIYANIYRNAIMEHMVAHIKFCMLNHTHSFLGISPIAALKQALTAGSVNDDNVPWQQVDDVDSFHESTTFEGLYHRRIEENMFEFIEDRRKRFFELGNFSNLIRRHLGLVHQSIFKYRNQSYCCLLYTSPSPRD